MNWRKNRTPLTHATNDGDLIQVKKLVKSGVDINERDGFGWTPLSRAVSSHKPEIVEFLLENGANPNATDLYGRTALHDATNIGNLELAKLLVQHGADVGIMNQDAATPLVDAVRCVHRDMIKYYLSLDGCGKHFPVPTSSSSSYSSRSLRLLRTVLTEMDTTLTTPRSALPRVMTVKDCRLSDSGVEVLLKCIKAHPQPGHTVHLVTNIGPEGARVILKTLPDCQENFSIALNSIHTQKYLQAATQHNKLKLSVNLLYPVTILSLKSICTLNINQRLLVEYKEALRLRTLGTKVLPQELYDLLDL